MDPESIVGLMDLSEALDVFQSEVIRRKEKLEADGMSTAIAERMALSMWDAMWKGVGK